MRQEKDNAHDSIIDFIDDEAYYAVKKSREEIDKGTFAIYLFATISLFSYVIFIMLNRDAFDWFSFAVNMLVVIIYYFLGLYSRHEPFNAFISALCIVGIVLLLNIILSPELTIRGIIFKIVFIVYIAMKLGAAKQVQAYKAKSLH